MAAGDSRSQASGTSPGPQSGGPGPAEALAPGSFYALLQLAEDASLEELRQAFRRQSKRLHPDTTSLPAALAQDSFRQLRQAYVTLLDPERRRAYDASLAVARARAGLGLRSSPGAPGLSPAGAAAGAGGPGIRPTQAAGGASRGGSAGMGNAASGAGAMGPIPGAASRQSNGGQGVPGSGASGANGLGGDGLGGNGLGAPGLGSSGLGVGDGLPKPDSVRRTLSGGEWFALLLLGLALVFCLVLGVGLAWLRGTELVREPSWWPAQESLELSQPAPVAPSRSQPPPSQPIPSPLPSLPQPQPLSAPLQPPAPLTPQPSTWPSSQASRALSSLP